MIDLIHLAYIAFLAVALAILVTMFRTPRNDYQSPESKDVTGYWAIETLRRKR